MAEQLWITHCNGVFWICPRVVRAHQSSPHPNEPGLMVHRDEGSEVLGAAVREVETLIVDYTDCGWPEDQRERTREGSRKYKALKKILAKKIGVSELKLRKTFNAIWLRFSNDRIYFRKMCPDRDHNDWGMTYKNEHIEDEPWLPNSASDQEIGEKLLAIAHASED